MCAKRQRRCPEALALREAAVEEWRRAETYAQVRATWGRLGGRVTLHRYGPAHYRGLGRRSALTRRRRTA